MRSFFPKQVITSSLHFFFIKQNLSGNLQSVLSRCIGQKDYEIQKAFILLQYGFSNKGIILKVKLVMIPLPKNWITLSKFQGNSRTNFDFINFPVLSRIIKIPGFSRNFQDRGHHAKG